MMMTLTCYQVKLTTLEAINSIPLWKLNCWLSIFQEVARYLFDNILVMNLLMVIKQEYYHLYYLPWILDTEWDAAHHKCLDCPPEIVAKYHILNKIIHSPSSKPLTTQPKRHCHVRTPKARHKRPPKIAFTTHRLTPHFQAPGYTVV